MGRRCLWGQWGAQRRGIAGRRRPPALTLILERAVHLGEVPELGLGLERDRPLLKHLRGELTDGRLRGLAERRPDRPLAVCPRAEKPLAPTGALITPVISSTNSRLAISARKWSPPFLMQVSTSCGGGVAVFLVSRISPYTPSARAA